MDSYFKDIKNIRKESTKCRRLLTFWMITRLSDFAVSAKYILVLNIS